MEIKANLNYLRISPRKVRLVADLIRGMDADEAETHLKFISKRAALPLIRLLNSAVANAKNNFNLEKDDLYIKQVIVNEGPPFKRWRAGSRGRAMPITKRTSHIKLVLESKKGVKIKEVKKKPIKAKPEVAEPEKIEKLAQKAEPVEPGPSKAEKVLTGKPKPRPPKKLVKKPEAKGLFKKIFRRKSF